MAGLVDTSALITLERRGTFLAEDLPDFLTGDFFISSVTVSELLVGLYRASSDKQRIRREQMLVRVFDSFPCLSFDFESARVHAEIQATMSANGQRIGAHDLIIAATALTYGHHVLTHNVRDFARVPGLDVKTVDW